MTYRLMNSLAELPRLTHHRKNLLFWLNDSDGDLAVMSRLARRVDDNARGIGRHRRNVYELYPQLVRLIMEKCACGRALTSLDIFMLNLRPHLDRLLAGDTTIYNLDLEYDWENNRFPV